MNLDYNPTLDQLKLLVASVDDTQDSHIMYVNKTGEVRLAVFRVDTSVGAEYANEDTLQFILDTFLINEGYTGPQAALDPEWMEELLWELTEHWACKTTGFAWKTSKSEINQ